MHGKVGGTTGASSKNIVAQTYFENINRPIALQVALFVYGW
jgi:hypothetical protein